MRGESHKLAGWRYALGMILLVFCVCFCWVDPAWVQQNDQQFFFLYKGEKVPLSLSTEHVAVRTAEPSGLNPMSAFRAGITPGDSHGVALPRGISLMKLNAGQNASEVMQTYGKLTADASTDLVAPVFKVHDNLMIVTDEFIAQFDSSTEETVIESLNKTHSVEVVQKADWAQNTYILRVQQGDALGVSNLYATSPGVVYAHPNFIRLMSNPRRGLEQPPNGRIMGPDGQLLPSGASIPRGSTHYRMEANTSIVAPISFRSDAEIPGQTGISPDAPVSRSTIKLETFDSGFPGPGWQTYGNPTWAATTHRAYEGSSSAYCTGSSVAPPGPYPSSADSWIVYGPFSLADASMAQVNLMAWIRSESSYDGLKVMASVDGFNF